ncbi:MAG: glycosyltransferase family 2 protein [Abditibacteriales bacterium]|nr:glycosyltransferase family 2 protein [Abditibacteriales bacterium]MDW8367825.1 glycosyltransferase family 2 protein [Abditibacteriales bacterium]
MKVSVVIPTLNRPEPLIGTLVSLLNQTWDDYEIIVVDQSPSPNPEVEALLLTAPHNVRYFLVDSKGSPAARNYGIEWATGDVVLSCDDDIIAHPTLIECHARNYADASIGGVAGRVLTQEDKPLSRIRHVGTCNYYTGWMTGNFNATMRCDVEHVQGANCSFRRAVLKQVGGFDEAFTPLGHFEEADLSLRVRRAGWRIVFDPHAAVTHLQHPAAGNRPISFRERTYWHFHNYGLLFWKDMRRVGLPLFLAVQTARAAGYAVRQRDPLLWGIGVCALARGLVRAMRESQRARAQSPQTKLASS